jgi:hypothetical protein
MEISCDRCHRAVLAENCYCPACGLPQLVYSADGSAGQVSGQASGEAPSEPWNEAVRDASSIDWKQAIIKILLLAIPAGVLSSGISPLGFFGLLWMSSAAAWAVVLYVRSQRPAWITVGAGARIGLVTGLLAGWLAFSISGGALFVERYFLHQSSQIDAEWKTRVEASQQMTQQWTAGLENGDAAQAQAVRTQVQAFMISPEGHAGMEAFGFACNAVFLLLFAIGGGALGARMLVRSRGPEV